MKADSVEQLQRLIGLDDIACHEPVQVVTRVEVHGERFARSGEPYRRLELYDTTGVVTAYARSRDWEGQGLMSGQLQVLCLHTVDTERGQRLLVAYPEVGAPPPQRDALELLPAHRAPQPCDLERLVSLVRQFGVPAYREFVQEVFSDPEFTLGFVTAPGARQCHHARDGGLLEHSLEVAEAARAAGEVMSHNVLAWEAGILLGLFHDVGKSVLWNADAERIPIQQHEALIEYALQAPLAHLKQRDLDAYHAMWQVIQAYRTGDFYVAPMAGVVRGLDACSAQADAAATVARSGRHRYWHRLCGGRRVWVPPARPGSSVESLQRR